MTLSGVERIANQLITKLQKRQKYVKYPYQELGLLIAEKLGEWQKRSFYIKLARDEDRQLIEKAFTYALYTNTNRAKVFLWKLEELKRSTTYRIFTSLFFDESENRKLLALYSYLKAYYKDYPNIKFVDSSKLHVTFSFWKALEGIYYPYLVRMVRRLREKYGDMIDINAGGLVNKDGRYLWLVNLDKIVYRIYYSQFKLVSGSIAKKIFSSKRGFYPHITLARIKQGRQKALPSGKIDEYFPLKLRGSIELVISKLTKEGPKYRLHKYY